MRSHAMRFNLSIMKRPFEPKMLLETDGKRSREKGRDPVNGVTLKEG